MFDCLNAKSDERSKKNGFAPGDYTCVCGCGDSFIGDKRSIECADCAYDLKKQLDNALNRLIYCCDGLNEDFNKSNLGDAKEWIRHIALAYQRYEEAKSNFEE